MKNKLFYIFFIAFLSGTASALSNLDMDEKALLHAELMFKKAAVKAIEAKENTYEALGTRNWGHPETEEDGLIAGSINKFLELLHLDHIVRTNDKIIVTIPVSVGASALTYVAGRFSRATVRAVTPNKMPSKEKVKKDNAAGTLSSNKSTPPGVIPENKTEDVNNDAKASNSKPKKPGVLYRLGRTIRGAGIAGIFAAEGIMYLSITHDAVVILADSYDDLQSMKQVYIEDITLISEILDESD